MSRAAALQRINTLIDQGQYPQAEAALRRAMGSDHNNPDLAGAMTYVLTQQGRIAQAEYFARQLAAARPTDPKALHNLGNILVTLGKWKEGITTLERALAIDPQMQPARQALALGLIGDHRYASAARALEDGLRASPDDPVLLNYYAHALHSIGRVEEAVPVLQHAAALAPDILGIAEHYCALVSYAPNVTPQENFDAHARYGLLEAASSGPAKVWTREGLLARRKPTDPIRIGLISPDLRSHAVAFLIQALIEYRDRSKTFIACYSSASLEDKVSDTLKKRADLWRNIYPLSIPDAAATIERDRMDALIDLAGHTNGNRINVMAKKPAPIQMTYMGFPNSTGLAAVDYRVVDSITDPSGDETLAVEKLLRLDPCFLSYRPPDDIPPVSALPCGDNGPITFAAFSGVLKFNTPMLAMWARVLTAVPTSRLLLKHFAFAEEEVRTDVAKRLVAAGARPDQLEIMPPEPTARQVLPWYHKVDIALDTFPYNGTTTFCEAFLMGVPMISLRGNTPPSRVGRSLLTAVNLPDLCATTEDQFVEIAKTLATDRPRLQHIRSTLRQTFLNCSICNGPGFAQRITDAVAWALAEATK